VKRLYDSVLLVEGFSEDSESLLLDQIFHLVVGDSCEITESKYLLLRVARHQQEPPVQSPENLVIIRGFLRQRQPTRLNYLRTSYLTCGGAGMADEISMRELKEDARRVIRDPNSQLLRMISDEPDSLPGTEGFVKLQMYLKQLYMERGRL